MHDIMNINLPNESATLALGAALASCARAGLVVWLDGDLGAGKTTLARGLLRALGDTGPVKSPTYTLVEIHVVSGLNLYHFDFYRFTQAEEYLDAGLDEYFNGSGICLVEWPDRAAPYLPAADLRLRLEVAGAGRRATLSVGSEQGRQCLTHLTNSAPLAALSSATLPPS
ncbi:MAG: tRNA (adenosine(37)-N6)-threonylcarbamoyltransferase complex ATPase subunit type 1 TsaE [Zoogloeaceae bacterium]|jgi:tRNA threonylcarbamoyladenosine biosynthesis protein TsaE|nr:tRNA (adenosine(37)-N6)-threonylcarbamoyltransferase complex ATPase subunit type 1 TsaE [Zoogloeaceae bacterium]